MVSTDDSRTQRLRRSAALALHRAVDALRRHPAAAPLRHAALRRCLECVTAATAEGPLSLELRADAVFVAGEVMPGLGVADGPFRALQAAGVGAIVLARDIAPAAIRELVQRLAAVRAEADAEAAFRLVAAPGLDAVQWRAGTTDNGGGRTAAVDWWALPEQGPVAAVLRPLVARDVACNLPALAARQLLDDLEETPMQNDAALTALLARLLQAGDLATATWLLTETAHHANVPKGAHRRLQLAAEQHADTAWLQRQLECCTGDEMLTLTAFVMELGEAAVERFAALTAATAAPWSQWLRSLLGSPGQS